MLSVNLITVGKLKESYLREACGEYVKRLGAFCKIKITELPESRLPDSPSEKEIAAALSNEGRTIIPIISGKSSYNIAMCVEGKQLSSEGLAEKISQISVAGKSALNIVIGSSHGISEDVKKASDLRLSMSEMTFPHQLARVMVLEQVYRSFQIINGGKYHK
ncbi:MAG: 23S rRNA (pseudouridine(1915)-N(3))-methyltransferase RlmH [Ruminococcus sp.]|nr:23S rRNA (pseudouridine(1915)-N(3))-methyltransferase RlmH [Ruminococcus sp.]MCM1380866.1 23S rRNA (pseudouridine(1915)-N(3))-methyltransferase RlmH [Muribaculaceae bacterium]MCM1480732.1 23S rRNA (pseudouridine(1915)-N(3))-methyltransferase RlmH [Muribaculaceae bacterium]